MRAAGVALPPSGPSTKVRSSRAGSRASASQHPRTRASEVNEEPAVTAAEDLLMVSSTLLALGFEERATIIMWCWSDVSVRCGTS